MPNEFRSVRRSWKEVLRNKEYERGGLEQVETPKKKNLEPLLLGDTVSVQNQYGNKKKRWSNTGVVVDVHPHRKYSIMIDGSRRVTQRNRKFLRRIPSDQRKLDYGMVPTMPPTCAPELATNVVPQSTQLPDQISQAVQIQPGDTRVQEHVAKPQVLEIVREEPNTTPPPADNVSTAISG